MLPRICQLILGCCIVCAGANAARGGFSSAEPDALANCKIQRWTTEDGLPQSRIACLQQTRDGYLWAGTWFGLARFDGAKFTVFNHNNAPTFASDTITALAEDADGALWIGTQSGLLKYRGGSFQRFTKADGLPDDHILHLAVSPEGGIWLQAGNEIVRVRQGRFANVSAVPSGQRVYKIEEDATGHLNVFCGNAWLEVTTDGKMLTNDLCQINTFYPNGETYAGGVVVKPGLVLLATTAGIVRVAKGETNVMTIGGTWSTADGLVLRESSGAIWAQSRGEGLRRFDGTGWQVVDLGESTSDIICATQDAQGNLWFGTINGLVQMQFQKVRVFTARDGLPDDNVWTVCQSADGTIWTGTDHGPAVVANNQAQVVGVFTNSEAGSIHCVWPARGDGVWVASQNDGIARTQNGQVVDQIKNIGVPSALFEDDAGRLWIATTGGAIQCFQNGREESLPGLERLRDIRAIYEDRQNIFWFGAPGELVRWHDGQLSVFGHKDGLPADRVWSICQNADGELWLGTEKGLVRFANGKFFQFNEQQKMPVDTVNCVLDDDTGCLWLSTLHGIFRIEREQLDAVADGKAANLQPFMIGTADGLKSAESNGEVQPAGWKASDGRLWFPTGKGLAVVDPKLFCKNESSPIPIIESIRADGVTISGPEKENIRIAASDRHTVEIQFTACDLAAPRQVRFRTRLAGLEQEWSVPTSDRMEDYSNLSPGTYRFEVQAADHHGIWSAQPVVLTFTITPRFRQTFWFYALCGGGLIALAAGIQAYRLRWQHRLLKLEQQRALAQERARIARDLHDDLGTALTGVALELDVLGRDAHDSSLLGRLGKTSQHIRQLAEQMREVVWAVNPRCDNLRSLADFLENQATSLLQAAGLRTRLDFPVEIPDLLIAANVRHQLALCIRETFSNLIRHARASEAGVQMEITLEQLILRVRDNGCGFNPEAELNQPHGLCNLKTRMEEIGGEFQITSAPNAGTEITFIVPLKKLKP